MNNSVFKQSVFLQKYVFVLFISLCFAYSACSNQTAEENIEVLIEVEEPLPILPGAYQFSEYIDSLKGKSVAVVSNHTGMVENTHLVDTLLSQGVEVVKIFAPEHGFRGKADAGELVKDGKDVKTGLPIVSLYGKHKKPYPEDLEGVDLVVFDIQDVGVRFYTYISTLEYVMEAAAENGVEVLVLDRPNPNIQYVDGPVLDTNFRSFIGMQPVPIVYGMSMAEYALMLKGEGWFNQSEDLALTVVRNTNYTRESKYDLPINPSPNLKTQNSIYLYPSLCFLEATTWSVGRGTDNPFEMYGDPNGTGSFAFAPAPNEGAKHPKFEGDTCKGKDLRSFYLDSLPTQLDLSFLIDAYEQGGSVNNFFKSSFKLICGSNEIKVALEEGKTESEIRASWQPGIQQFLKIREKYLLYE